MTEKVKHRLSTNRSAAGADTDRALIAEERYQAFIQNSTEGIWCFELEQPIKTDLPAQKQIRLMYDYAYLTEANLAMARMYGFRSIKPLIGKRLGDLLIENDPTNRSYLQAFITSNYILTGVESHERDKHGHEKYFRNSLIGIVENGYLVRAWGTQQDITDEWLAHEHLRESEERFRVLADTAPILMWVADTTKACTYFNKGWLSFTGTKLEDQTGDGWEKSVHSDDLKRCKEVYETAFDARKPFTQEYRLRRHDGEYRWVLDTGTPRYSSSGEFQGYIGSCIDIDDIKHTQELRSANTALRHQREQLMELNKSKDEFISLASHQLRTPATGVKQYLGMLLDGYGGELTETQVQMLKTAYDSNERQLTIIDDLLRVAHVDAGKVILRKEKVDLYELLGDVISEQADTFKRRRQTVILRSRRKRIPVTIDKARMRMVFENILDNASKYSEEGKRIFVTLTATTTDTQVAVKDEGVGIAKRDLPKLFQKFSRLNNKLSVFVGGTGIGLYWAQKIVDLHHGAITVKSTLHKGTTFTVTIPKRHR